MARPEADALPPATLLQRLEYWAASGLLGLLGLLPPTVSSAVGGWLLRAIGPLLGVHKVARINLRAAFPDRDEAWIRATLRGMWDNLGRVLGELPHTAALVAAGRVEAVGLEHVRALEASGRPAIFFAAHLGNWEMMTHGSAAIGLRSHIFYRAPSNPLMAQWYAHLRRGALGEFLPKGVRGARRAVQLLSQGEHLGMLVDQKMNDGIPVPLFGREAMTGPAAAVFTLKYKAWLVPTRVVRLPGCRFRMEFHPPLAWTDTGDRLADQATVMGQINRQLEVFIREHPEQWLWVHRRWPKSFYKS